MGAGVARAAGGVGTTAAAAVWIAAAFFAPGAPTAGAAGVLDFGRTASVKTGGAIVPRFAAPFEGRIGKTTSVSTGGVSTMASCTATFSAAFGAAFTGAVTTGAADTAGRF